MPRVIHFEIHVDDPQRAKAFYGSLFGWQFTDWGGPHEYTLIQTGTEGPGIDGGMLRRQVPLEGPGLRAFVCTVDVPSVDETCEQITALGGEIAMPKMAVPNVGWLAYGKDPEGNLFGIMQMDPSAA